MAIVRYYLLGSAFSLVFVLLIFKVVPLRSCSEEEYVLIEGNRCLNLPSNATSYLRELGAGRVFIISGNVSIVDAEVRYVSKGIQDFIFCIWWLTSYMTCLAFERDW